MKKELLDEFIAFAKAEYGLTVEAIRSNSPDSFEKMFGGSFSNNMNEEQIKLGVNEKKEHETRISLGVENDNF